MRLLLAVVLAAAGVTASLIGAGVVAVVYQDLVGVQPDVLGFEDIRDLSAGQERVQLILAG